jgi:hypothetical protein
MKDTSSPISVCVLTNPKAARVLMDGESRRWFMPFFNQSSTVSQAARQLGESPNSVLYRVKAWCKLGLLEVVATRTQGKRRVKEYASVAQEFFMPYQISQTEDLIDLVRTLNTAYNELLFKSYVMAGQHLSVVWGVQFSRVGQNEYRISPATAPGQEWNPFTAQNPATLNDFNTNLRLDFADAKALQLELHQVVQKYVKKQGQQGYICHIALAPLAAG